MKGPFVGKKKYSTYIDSNIYSYWLEIKIQYMDVNYAVHLLEISSTQKLKNRHLKQCVNENPVYFSFRYFV